MKWYFGGAYDINGKEWDRGIMDKYGESGHPMICDVKGDGLRLRNIKDGIRVKLRTRNPHFEGYEYLNENWDQMIVDLTSQKRIC